MFRKIKPFYEDSSVHMEVIKPDVQPDVNGDGLLLVSSSFSLVLGLMK